VKFLGLKQGEEFQRLMSQLKKAATPPLGLQAPTSEICFTKLLSGFTGHGDEISPLWRSIRNGLHANKFPDQDLAVERLHQEREAKLLVSNGHTFARSQDSPLSLVQNFKWSDNFFADEDDILAVFDIDYPRVKITRFFATWVLILFAPMSAIGAAMAKGERIELRRVFLCVIIQWTFSLLTGFLHFRMATFLFILPSSTWDRNKMALAESFRALKFLLGHAFPFSWIVDRRGLRSMHVAACRSGIIIAKENQISNSCGWLDSGTCNSWIGRW